MQEKNFLRQVNDLPRLKLTDSLYEIASFDIPTIIANTLFRDLERAFDSGIIALHQGIIENHPNVSSNDNNETAILWIRFEFLKYSILWYNSCVDYLLQIIYFQFNFYRIKISKQKQVEPQPEITNRALYERYLSNCTWREIKKIFQIAQKYSSNAFITELFQELTSCYENNRTIREWANKLKHKGGFVVNGLDDKIYNYSFPFDNKEVNSDNIGDLSEFDNNYLIYSSIFRTETIEKDRVIEELLRSHMGIYQFALFLYNFIDYENIHNREMKFNAKDLLLFFSNSQ